MASDGANEEPYASEYAEKGSPTDSDNDEGTNVEPNASVTKLLTTQGIRDSNESTNADAENTIAMETLKQLKTLIMRKEKRPETLTQEERDLLASLVERGLDILDLPSDGDAESAPPTETRPADGSSSKSPLDMEDGNRENSTFATQEILIVVTLCVTLSERIRCQRFCSGRSRMESRHFSFLACLKREVSER